MATVQQTPNIPTIDIYGNRSGVNRQLISRFCETLIHTFDAHRGYVHASESFWLTLFNVKQNRRDNDDLFTLSFFSRVNSTQTREVIDRMANDSHMGVGSITHDVIKNHVTIEFTIAHLRKSYEGR